MRRLVAILVALLLMASPAWAASFTNGGFETGDWTGWNTGGGYWTTAYAAPSPTSYLPAGVNYSPGVFESKSAIVTPGNDPIVGALLPRVYAGGGSYSARVNNWDNGAHVSVISQTVPNYTDTNIYFAWAAVLESSHGVGESDYFALKLTDDTAGNTLYSVSYDSASTPGYFHSYGSWYYSDWQLANLDVSARSGHTFTLTLLGSDCPYGGHAGYVYLDGFGSVAPPVNGVVPEPASMVLMGIGLVGAALKRRKK